jgi:hypothetical protein
MTIITGGPIGGGPVIGYPSDTNYANLLIDVGEWTGRNDISSIFPLLLHLAEAKLNRNLRTGYQETTADVELVDGVATLPVDFLEARAYVADDARQTDFLVRGQTIESLATPPWNGNLTVSYYAKIPALSPAHPTNWLLELDYNVYLYALAVEVFIWAKNAEMGQVASSMRDSAISTVILNDENARWGRSRVTNRDLTP